MGGMTLALLSASHAAMPTLERILYSFTGGTDGGHPHGDLIRDAAGV